VIGAGGFAVGDGQAVADAGGAGALALQTESSTFFGSVSSLLVERRFTSSEIASFLFRAAKPSLIFCG